MENINKSMFESWLWFKIPFLLLFTLIIGLWINKWWGFWIYS